MSRLDKVSEAIRQEVSLIVHDKLKDPRLGFVTITSVEMTKDLSIAKVFFSVLGSQEDYKKTAAALESGMGLIRSLVAQRVNLKFAPEILFRPDRSSEYSVRIEEVLNEIKEIQNANAPVKKQARGRSPKKRGQDEPKKNRRRPKKIR